MVSSITIVALIISTLLCFLFPFALYFIVSRKANKLFVPFIAGAIGFFVMQMIIRIPLISFLQLQYDFETVNIFILAFILGLTAALFETFGRVITIKLFLKKDYRFTSGIAHGIGHGGIEAIMLVGLSYLSYIIYAFMINNGSFDSLLSIPELGSEYALLKDILIDTPSHLFFLGGIERILTIFFHITLSVLTIYAFRIKKKYPIVIVVLVHTFLDFSVVIMSYYGLDAILIEVYIFLMTGIMIFGSYKIYKKYLQLKEGEENV